MTVVDYRETTHDPSLEVLIRSAQTLTLPAYMGILSEIRHSLQEVDRLAVPGRVSRLEWGIKELSGGRNARVLLVPARRPARRPEGTISASSTGYVEGLQDLRAEPAIPPYFSASVVQRVQRIGERLESGEIEEVRLSSINGKREDAIVDRNVASQARQAVLPASKTFGSVIGKLDVLVAKNTKQPRGEITLPSRQAVLFRGANDQMQQLRDAWGQRVMAAGLLTRNSVGQAVRLELTELEVLPDRERITPWNLLGIAPGATGDMSTSEYLESIRRG